jgi:hypothetical protein
MEAQVALRHHARAGMDLIDLRMLSGHHFYARADGGTITLGAEQFDGDPILLVAAVVPQKRRVIVHVQDQHVDVTIVIVVAEGATRDERQGQGTLGWTIALP